MEIRQVTSADIDAAARLHCQFRDSLQKQAPAEDEFRSSIARVLTSGHSRMFIAVLEGEAVGYTAMTIVATAWSATNVAVLDDLFVAESCRGRRIGRSLVEAAIREASALGCTAMSLDTNERNESSQAIYRGLGFTCERARWGDGRQIRYDLRLR